MGLHSFLGFSSAGGIEFSVLLVSLVFLNLKSILTCKISIDRVGENPSVFPIIANTVITYCSIIVLGSLFCLIFFTVVAASMLIMKWQGFLSCVR